MTFPFINFRAVNLRKNDFMYITEMLTIGILVPEPQKISGFSQILLPFEEDVWVTIGETFLLLSMIDILKSMKM